ncbi:MAG: hypothetical protein J6333_12190, partial [Planctomycetes bacterium]|nr:hypothetical protein [Planctomycetota bacterium]
DIVATIKKQISPASWNESKTVVRWEDNIIVFNTPEVQQQVAKFLEEWRRSSKQQVLVEGRFMDIDDDFVEEFGIDWSGAQQGQNSHREYQTGLSFAGGAVDNTWGATTDDTSRTGGLFTRMGLVSTNNPLNYALNTLRLNLTIRASQQSGKGSILHNPKVLVQNGETAYCQVIVNRPYVGNFTVNGNNMLPVLMNVYQGVTWEVRPVISFDRKYVMLKVRPEIAQEVTDEELISRGIIGYERRIRMAVPLQGGNDDGAAVLANWYVEIERPVSKITDFWTNVVVPDGGTLMIGGQLRDNSTDEVTGVPVLSSVPYLGRLMRTDSRTRTSTNRVIMVSAKIVEMEE